MSFKGGCLSSTLISEPVTQVGCEHRPGASECFVQLTRQSLPIANVLKTFGFSPARKAGNFRMEPMYRGLKGQIQLNKSIEHLLNNNEHCFTFEFQSKGGSIA